MRVTELTKHNAVQKNLNRTSESLQKILVGVSNGKVLNKPSDDPVGAAKVQDFHTSINHSKTLEKNIVADKVWLSSCEATIRQIVEIMMHVKQLALEGSNGATTNEFRQSLSKEIELITNDLINLGNKKEGKLYLFSGTKTFTKPLEIQPSIKPADVRYYGTRIKSDIKTVPIDQDKPMTGILPGSFTIQFEETEPFNPDATKPVKIDGDGTQPLNNTENVDDAVNKGENLEASDDSNQVQSEDDESKPNEIKVFLTGAESLKEIIEKINQAAIEEQGYTEDSHYQSGFSTKINAEIGKDNAVYLDPSKGVNVKFGDDTTGFLQKMNFKVIGAPPESASLSEEDAEMSGLSIEAIGANEYEADFDGYSKENYQLKVIKGGTFGIAQYIVSDDEGKTWSKPLLLQRQNEIFDPDGKASNKVNLHFGIHGDPFIREGLEFHFTGNEFVKYNGNEQIKQVTVDNGIKVALNIHAKQIFNKDLDNEDTVNIFDMMIRLKEAMKDDDQDSIIKSIDETNFAINQVLYQQSKIGSIFRELESSEDRIEKNIDFKQGEMSAIEDMDLAKGAVDLNKAELQHKTALDSSARLIQPTLINFLK